LVPKLRDKILEFLESVHSWPIPSRFPLPTSNSQLFAKKIYRS